MVAPATKRRKIRHADSADESGSSIADADIQNAALRDDSSNESPADDSDVSMDDSAHDELDGSDDNESSEEEDDEVEAKAAEKQTATSKKQDAPKPHPRKEQLQDGVYTAETFKSNVFKLQVDELLEQVKPKYGKKEAPAENAMRTLKSIIEQLPSRTPLPIPEAEKQLKSAGVVVPFPNPRPPKDAQYKLQFERPSSINATGSYPLKTTIRAEEELAIDLVVTIPKALLQEKDYLNYRYFYKRAYYLACLAAGIKSSKEHSFKLSFDCLHGNQLQPIIVVRPSGDGSADDFSSSKCRIQIIAALPETAFNQNKLLPTSNCVRPKGGDESSESSTLDPTPFYNSTVQADANVTAYLKLLHAASSKCDAFKDACILGRIWLRQRGFSSRLRKGGFGNFEWAAVMAILLQPNPGAGAPPLAPGYSSYQLFKATLQFIARHSLNKKPFSFQANGISFPKSDLTPVFFDGPRKMNILYKMTAWSYSRLQMEAKTTVDMLSDSSFDHFDSAFILKTDLVRYGFDTTLELPLSALGLVSSGDEYDAQLAEACRKIYSVLTRALTDRITSISLTMPEEDVWSISSRKRSENQAKCILVNLETDPANASRTVDHGPAAEQKKEAAAFRGFWGEKAELRRFKDGSILESVVWSLKDTSASVLEQIIRYILGKHLNPQAAEEARFTTDSFAHLISQGRIQGSSGISAFLPFMNAVTTVEQNIRDLEGLPLTIRHIRAADPQLRYASIDPPVPMSINEPASLIIQFEGSARWPDDLCAIQRTKTAFLLKISDLLSASHPEYSSRVGLENPSNPSQNQAYLDVVLPVGFAFRIRVHHDREATLLDRQLKDKSLDAQSRESAANALALYKRDFIQIPAHTQVLQTLCTRFPALSPAIRLTKKWFASHLLSSHFAPELIELLVVQTFLQPYPWSVPSCATTAFLRTLSWISRWDWRHSPLLVDFSSHSPSDPTAAQSTSNKGMKSEEIEKLRTRFEAWRRIDPAMNRVVLFAATNIDAEGTTWTDQARPEKVVAARMTALTKAATTVIRSEHDKVLALVNGDREGKHIDEFEPESLFVSQLQDYDVVIHIASKFSKSGKKKTLQKYKNLQMHQDISQLQQDESLIAQLFVDELKSVYGDAILWFWNPESVDRIAGLWNPVVTGQRSWKIKAGWNSVPVHGQKQKKADGAEERGVDIQLNRGAICNEIKRLGGEMVSRIDVK